MRVPFERIRCINRKDGDCYAMDEADVEAVTGRWRGGVLM
jgi:hypothetical protein